MLIYYKDIEPRGSPPYTVVGPHSPGIQVPHTKRYPEFPEALSQLYGMIMPRRPPISEEHILDSNQEVVFDPRNNPDDLEILRTLTFNR